MQSFQHTFSLICLAAWFTTGAVTLPGSLYLFRLMVAAARNNRRKLEPERETLGARFIVLIPAHNEEVVLEATLASLAAQNYPKNRFEVIVVADNCSDTTAAIAEASGATVFERTNLEQRGKGFALEWAIQKIAARSDYPCDALVIVDADTEVQADYLRIMASRLFSGTPASQWPQRKRVLQGRYGVLNTEESWRSALMAAAFDLVNHVKPLGRDYLGLSVGLKGNGMAFTWATLQAAPWSGSSVTEDIDYGLDLLQFHSIVAGYAPDAIVRAQMPTSGKQASSQRERWERGRYHLLKVRAPKLLLAGLKTRNIRLIDAAFDLIFFPIAELAALHLLWLGLTTLLFNLGALLLPWLALPALSLFALTFYILGGLRISKAPKEAYIALLRAPIYTAWKLILYVLVRLRGGAKKSANSASVGSDALEWVRTERAPIAKTPVAKNTKEPDTADAA
jgi:1,2-diacylglycerol 3-beta-glucosyltransferase